jgi:DNA recombination protein RmuC
MESVIYFIVVGLVGLFIGILIANLRNQSASQADKDQAKNDYNNLELDYVRFKSTAESQLDSLASLLKERENDIMFSKESESLKEKNLQEVHKQLSIATANLDSANQTILEKKQEHNIDLAARANIEEQLTRYQQLLATANAENELATNTLKEFEGTKAQAKSLQLVLSETESKYAVSDAKNKSYQDKLIDYDSLTAELKKAQSSFLEISEKLATSNADNKSLKERLESQKAEIETLGKKFSLEFENIANKIFESKSEKFTKLNSDNLKNILEPLGQNINDFKKQVDEVYKAESKERFSLGEKVKELSELNKVISEEAHNLTKALKGESKTQGRWGEMILESVLDRSGLEKNRHYFMEHELMDKEGKPLRTDSEGKKMRPDAVIKYPDNRNVIIDSKVSLNAFTRLIAAVDVDSQKIELIAHVSAIKNHIVLLSNKGYDDYDKSLDFVMLFIPSEPAYIAAMQHDADLWNFAYDRRILLISPTNLITSLKLIVDLWKRDDQNQNAREIANRGAKLYDKFVGFIKNLEDVGAHLEKAQGKFHEAHKQLVTGNDNLVTQATKLKNLGLNPKHVLSESLVNNALIGND